MEKVPDAAAHFPTHRNRGMIAKLKTSEGNYQLYSSDWNALLDNFRTESDGLNQIAEVFNPASEHN
jgi:hypothetical protein